MLNTNLGGHTCSHGITVRVSPFETCSRRDVVLIRSQRRFDIGEIWLNVVVDDEAMTLISLWTIEDIDDETHVVHAQISDNPQLIASADILAPTIYSKPRAGLVRALIPCPLRS